MISSPGQTDVGLLCSRGKDMLRCKKQILPGTGRWQPRQRLTEGSFGRTGPSTVLGTVPLPVPGKTC
jgi:hypothetical protein